MLRIVRFWRGGGGVVFETPSTWLWCFRHNIACWCARMVLHVVVRWRAGNTSHVQGGLECRVHSPPEPRRASPDRPEGLILKNIRATLQNKFQSPPVVECFKPLRT